MNDRLRHVALALFVVAAIALSARAQDEFETNPLDGAIADMQVAGGRLARLATDKITQQKQQAAIDKIDALIKLLEEQRQQPGSRVNARPDRPAQDSMIREGPGGSGPLHAANRQGRSWGQLPARQREQILQSMTEGFPPHYQQLLERYYRRLAEERPVDASGEQADNPEPAK